DIVKALALGASAVQVGRPCVYGLAVGGAAGGEHVLKLLRQELLMAMSLLGCPTIPSITRDLLRRCDSSHDPPSAGKKLTPAAASPNRLATVHSQAVACQDPGAVRQEKQGGAD